MEGHNKDSESLKSLKISEQIFESAESAKQKLDKADGYAKIVQLKMPAADDKIIEYQCR